MLAKNHTRVQSLNNQAPAHDLLKKKEGEGFGKIFYTEFWTNKNKKKLLMTSDLG